eukprot:gene20389-20459_t
MLPDGLPSPAGVSNKLQIAHMSTGEPGKFQGRVIEWNDNKGFGFIHDIVARRDIFTHRTALVAPVVFDCEIDKRSKKLQTQNVSGPGVVEFAGQPPKPGTIMRVFLPGASEEELAAIHCQVATCYVKGEEPPDFQEQKKEAPSVVLAPDGTPLPPLVPLSEGGFIVDDEPQPGDEDESKEDKGKEDSEAKEEGKAEKGCEDGRKTQEKDAKDGGKHEGTSKEDVDVKPEKEHCTDEPEQVSNKKKDAWVKVAVKKEDMQVAIADDEPEVVQAKQGPDGK